MPKEMKIPPGVLDKATKAAREFVQSDLTRINLHRELAEAVLVGIGYSNIPNPAFSDSPDMMSNRGVEAAHEPEDDEEITGKRILELASECRSLREQLAASREAANMWESSARRGKQEKEDAWVNAHKFMGERNVLQTKLDEKRGELARMEAVWRAKHESLLRDSPNHRLERRVEELEQAVQSVCRAWGGGHILVDKEFTWALQALEGVLMPE